MPAEWIRELQSEPEPLDERLRRAPSRRDVITLGPEQAGAMYARLAELEAIRRRAVQVRDDDLDHAVDPMGSEWRDAARYILGEA